MGRQVGAFGSVAFFGVLTFMTALSSCGKGNGGGGNFNAPPVAPIVNAALPASMRASSTSTTSAVKNHTATHSAILAPRGGGVHSRAFTTTPSNSPSGEMTVAAQAIKAMFTEYYGNPNNGNWYQGYLNNLVLAIDMRMSGISSQVAGLGTAPPCLSNAVSSESFNLSTIDPMLNFTSPYLQCKSTFEGGATGSGAGDAFGSSGGNYSLWLYLSWAGSGTTYDQLGGFFAAANVINYGSTSTTAPETVDGVLIMYAPPSNQDAAITISRFTASPTTNSFALFIGSNEPNTSGGSSATNTNNSGDSSLGSGVRIISDGQHVYADGLMLDTNSNEFFNFNVCLNASDLNPDNNVGDCNALANNYVTTTWATLYGSLGNPNPLATSATLSYTEVTGCDAELPSGTTGLPASNPSNGSCAGSSVAIPGNVAGGDNTAPSAQILSALSAIGLPTSLSSL